MSSAALAAGAILAGPGTAAVHYRQLLNMSQGRFAAVASPLHHAAINGSPVRVAVLGRALTLPVVGKVIAPTWALTWNDLLDGAPPGSTTTTSRLVLAAGRMATRSTAIAARLHCDLSDR
jgi:hypothetical protein